MTDFLSAPYAAAAERSQPMTREEFEAFYRETAPGLRSYIRRITGNHDDDLLHDAYVRLLGVRTSHLEPRQVRSYLYRIATTILCDRWRRVRRHRAWQAETAYLAGDHQPDLPESGFARCFGQLELRERMMLWLAHVEGLEHKEIAGVMALRSASVRVLLFRARRRLERILRENGWEQA